MGRELIVAGPEFAPSAGFAEPALWTVSVPGAAGSIRQHAGFEQVGGAPHHGFGQDLIGRDRRLIL
ncbi:hypothetical protein ACFVTP_24165 [Streptomyces celluloflavus]|uniref:hypothetical protein n=1 Tax=Streptomyces celluloflavus TaxID=58344 RepID=UPI0036DD575C